MHAHDHPSKVSQNVLNITTSLATRLCWIHTPQACNNSKNIPKVRSLNLFQFQVDQTSFAKQQVTIASDISVWEVQYNLVFISSILNADDSQLSEGGHESEDAKESESHSAIDEPQTETPAAAETNQTETVDASEADQPENKVGVN